MSPTRLPRIWERELEPIAQRVSIPQRASGHLADNGAPYRVAVNFQDWHKHSLRAEQDGLNSQLQILVCRLMRYACWKMELVVVCNHVPDKKQKQLFEALKPFIEALGFEWLVAPRLANEELAHLFNSGQIHDILCDDVDPLTYGAGQILRNPNVSLSNQNADGDYDSSEIDHADLYAMEDIINNPNVPFSHREDLICANLCISRDTGYSNSTQELARTLSRTGLSRRICQAVVETADAQVREQITKQWVADVVEALLHAGIVAAEHDCPEHGAYLQRIATFIENAGQIHGFDLGRLACHMRPVTSADGGVLLKSHASRFDLAKIGSLCEGKFWDHDHTMNIFTRRLYPAVIAHILYTAIREHNLIAQRDKSNTSFAIRRVVQYISTLNGRTSGRFPGPFFKRVTSSPNPDYPEHELQFDLQVLDSIVEHDLSGVQRVRRRQNEVGLAYVFATLTRQALPNLCHEADARRPAARSAAPSTPRKAPGSKVVVTPPPTPRKRKNEKDMEEGARGSKALERLWAEMPNTQAEGSSRVSQSETHLVERMDVDAGPAASPSKRTKPKAPSKSKAINKQPKVAKGVINGFLAQPVSARGRSRSPSVEIISPPPKAARASLDHRSAGGRRDAM